MPDPKTLAILDAAEERGQKWAKWSAREFLLAMADLVVTLAVVNASDPLVTWQLKAWALIQFGAVVCVFGLGKFWERTWEIRKTIRDAELKLAAITAPATSTEPK